MAKRKDYRIFTELLPIFRERDVQRKIIVLSTLFLIIIMFMLIAAVYMVNILLMDKYTAQRAKRERFSFWMEKTNEYPFAPDIFYNAAISAMEIGRRQTAQQLLDRAVRLDPSFYEARELQDVL